MVTQWENQLSSLRRVAFDTNALIYFLEDIGPYAPYVAQAVASVEAGQALGLVSSVVEMELLVKPIREGNAGALDKAEIFFRDTHNLAIRAVDRVIARRAAEVRAHTRLGPFGLHHSSHCP